MTGDAFLKFLDAFALVGIGENMGRTEGPIHKLHPRDQRSSNCISKSYTLYRASHK